MLSSRNKNSSPAKENISPDGANHSPRKQIPTIKQLIQLLKQHNIPIPQQLIEKTIPSQKPSTQIKLKEVVCDNSQDLKRMRIELNDSKFELKKTEEDFAEFKVMSRMEKQKLTKRYLSEIDQLKRKVQQDNTNWQKRYTQKCQQFADEKKVYEEKIFNEYKTKVSNESSGLKQQYQGKIQSLEKKIAELSSNIKQKQSLFREEKQRILQECQKKVELEVNIVKTTLTEKEKQVTKKLQSKIEVIELEKKIDNKKSQDVTLKLQTEITKLKNDLYFLQKDKDQLNAQLKTKDRKILQLEMAIRAKQQVYLSTQQVFDDQKRKIHEQNQEIIKKIQQSHVEQIKQIMTQHLNQLDSYYQRINSLQQKKKAAQTIMKDEMCILQHKFTQRLSKPEDIEEIQRLNTELVLKERELARFQDELRSSQLVRVNNEKNYTRIFSAHSSRRKSSNSHRDNNLFKQSNTTDLKLLLKICNKDF